MWGAQPGWNQWAMQPAMFNDVPHEQIDWAALAKQWIQMQQSQPSSDPSGLPPAHVGPPPPPGHSPILPEDLPPVSAPLLKTPVAPGTLPEPFQPERPFEAEPSSFVAKPSNHTYWKNDMERAWPVHPVEPTPPIIGGKETFDYGHMHDNPPLAMQSIDYNHMSEFSYNQVPQVYVPPDTQYDQYWSQVNAAPPIAPIFLKKERSSAPSSSHRTEEDTSQIDAAKRKQLPAWIREGLEKMEQERIKKIEKERAEKEKAEKLAKDKLKSELALKEGGNSLMPVKSKFDSDSETEEVVDTVSSSVRKTSPVSKRSPSPDIRTEEEKRLEFMLNVRRLLTEILLDVTNAEMQAVAEEVLKKEKWKKLKAQQLASTTKLTSVASGLRGLADYGTESEASEVEEEEKDSSESEEELYRIIREKKKQFAIKGKKILADLERKELEEQKEALKSKNDSSNLENKLADAARDPAKSFANEEKTPIPFLAPVADKEFSDIPFIEAKADSSKEIGENNSKIVKNLDKKGSNSSDSSSSSSGSGSSEKNKSHKSESDKKSSSKESKDKSKHRSRSSESDSSDRHHKSRSHDRYSKKSSNSKKRKKYKRSDSSSSSSSETRRRKHSSKSNSSHNHYRDHRSESYDDKDKKRRRSVSPRSYRSSRDSYRSRESYYRHDRDKHDKRDGYYDHKRSPSPHRRSSKLPKKYRSSRSPSSERESSRKSRRSRNH